MKWFSKTEKFERMNVCGDFEWLCSDHLVTYLFYEQYLWFWQDTQMQGKLKVMFLEARGKTEIEKGPLPTECQQMIHVKYVIFLST